MTKVQNRFYILLQIKSGKHVLVTQFELDVHYVRVHQQIQDKITQCELFKYT